MRKHIFGLSTAIAFVSCLAGTVSTPLMAQDLFTKRYTLNEQLTPFEGEKLHCLAFCMELIVEKTDVECSPVMAPPIEGCDLPWIDPQRPNPLPPGNPMEWCIPEEPELAGYKLHHHTTRERRIVTHDSNCESISVDTVLEVLPETWSTRACPDPGPWGMEDERILSFRWVSCPESE